MELTAPSPIPPSPSPNLPFMQCSLAAYRTEADSLHKRIALLLPPTPRLREALEDAEGAVRVLLKELGLARRETSSARAETAVTRVRSERNARAASVARREVEEGIRHKAELEKILLKRVKVAEARVKEASKLRNKLENQIADGKQRLAAKNAAVAKLQGERKKWRETAEDMERALAKAEARAQSAEDECKAFSLPPSSMPAAEAGDGGPSEDAASESRSRFTDTLPWQDVGHSMDGAIDEPDAEVVGAKNGVGTARNRRQPVLKTIRDTGQSTRPKKRQRHSANSDMTVSDEPGDALLSRVARKASATPKKRRRKVDIDADAAPTQASKQQSHSSHPLQERIAGGRQLRSRRPVSYDYNLAGRDIVNAAPGYEVDKRALRVRQLPKQSKSKVRNSAQKKKVVDPAVQVPPRRLPLQTVRKTVGR